MASLSDCWLQYRRVESNASVRLFCFPYAGGNARLFRAWSEQLSPDIEVCPIQLPGREHRIAEAPHTRLLELIENLIDVLTPYLDQPYAFFGHSMGALISFELARALSRRAQGTLLRLFASAHRAPQFPLQHLPIYTLPDARFIQMLQRYSGMTESILQNRELMQLLLPLLRADFELCETYQYVSGPRLSCSISSFGGIYDPEITREHLEGWKEQTTGAYRLHFFAGDHFYIHQHTERLLEILQSELKYDLSQR